MTLPSPSSPGGNNLNHKVTAHYIYDGIYVYLYLLPCTRLLSVLFLYNFFNILYCHLETLFIKNFFTCIQEIEVKYVGLE